jgi:diguanylate cyclase (GGDEF)-like protein/putative nucleotidyltransferase with HDIG domain
MNDFAKLRPTVRAYVSAVVIVGLGTIAYCIHALSVNPIGTQWFTLAALTLLTGSFTVKVPSINAHISVSETFVFASVLLFGPAAGAMTVLLECLVINFWIKHGRPVHRILFNITAPAIAIWISGSVFFLISDIELYSIKETPLHTLFLPLVVFTTLYFLLNSSLVAIALGLETQESPFQIWWKNFTWLSVNYFSGASVAALIVTYTRDLDPSTLPIIVPLLVVSYLTFRTAMGRVEDSNVHLCELNRLYLSTIETLAMAIDAKDQITHGHIRRVQAYAVGLASHVGVTDPKLIKAIEAAALLHDMGKLAIPEYILNKPGRLSNSEFERMKLHASIGADILSAIDFPYPVVPMVRHHHENWDGTGYPDRLRGTDIPIGARILSVVDCFDALTSDRPYRPRLSADEALQILIDRRGSMYDPLVIDTFVRVHAEIARDLPPNQLPTHLLNEIVNSRNSAHALYQPRGEDTPSADGVLTLWEVAQALAGQASIADTGEAISKHIRTLIPFEQFVLFLYNPQSDELEAKHATGQTSSMIKGIRISLGQKLSGWVAANHQTIVNSDPALDLGDIVQMQQPRYRSSLSTPLMCDGQLVGVLTLYSEGVDAFSDDHRRAIEVVAHQVGPTLKFSAQINSPSGRSSIMQFPDLQQLEQLLQSTARDSFTADDEMALLFIDVPTPSKTYLHGRLCGGEVLHHVARSIRRHLKPTDILCRSRSDGFVALLTKTDRQTAKSLGQRIERSLREEALQLAGGELLAIDATTTCVSVPHDGNSLGELIAAAHTGTAQCERTGSSRVR